MKTIAVSQFKAHCLGLLKEIEKTGNPLAVTLRGQPLATVFPPQKEEESAHKTVRSTLRRLRPFLAVEEEEFEPPQRSDRASALAVLADE